MQEKQLYLKEIAEACVGHDDNRRVSALQSLEVDTGLQIILPRLSRLIYYAVSSYFLRQLCYLSLQIRCNVIHRSLSILIYIVRMIRAITLNKSVKLEGVVRFSRFSEFSLIFLAPRADSLASELCSW